jgi:hypothetical protein
MRCEKNLEATLDDIDDDEDEGPPKPNTIKCVHCLDEIESTHQHDFKRCSCRKVAVDGGSVYRRLIGDAESILVMKNDIWVHFSTGEPFQG